MTPLELAHAAEELAQEVVRAAGKLQNLADLVDDLEKMPDADTAFAIKEMREILND